VIFVVCFFFLIKKFELFRTLFSCMNNRGDIRVLLFDIDGTLLLPARRGVYRDQIRTALIEIFGTAGLIDSIAFGGKTDLQILREALEGEGIKPEQIRAVLPEVERRFISILVEMQKEGQVFNCCPGVESLLERLSCEPRYLLSLLTGNVEMLAQAKLESAGLARYFRHRGAFGSDEEDRRLLPAIACARITEALSAESLSPEQFIVIGDTPRDIACARHFGARAVAVASGGTTFNELAAEGPDLLFADLSDTDAVVDALSTL
jgi:phosphoglycolate phosphatase-like HAD superfamily hydrolase